MGKVWKQIGSMAILVDSNEWEGVESLIVEGPSDFTIRLGLKDSVKPN
jgi:hypothetical protein